MITEADRAALKQVRDGLCSGTITHNKFRMSKWTSRGRDGCRTAHCIGGWAALISPGIIQRSCLADGSTHLFIPENVSNWDTTITTCAAIRAIDNFLETGHPNWPEALKDPTK